MRSSYIWYVTYPWSEYKIELIRSVDGVPWKYSYDRRVKIEELRSWDYDHEYDCDKMDKRYVYCMEHGTFELTTGLIKSSFSSMIEKLDFYASDNFGINKNNIGSLS